MATICDKMSQRLCPHVFSNILLVMIWLLGKHCTQCSYTTDKKFNDRFSDTLNISVLNGTEATLNYTGFPFRRITSIIFDNKYDGRNVLMGRCLPAKTVEPCKPLDDDVTFEHPVNYTPYFTFPDVTLGHAGQYRIRYMLENRTKNPSFLDVHATLNVYTDADFTVVIDIDNGSDTRYEYTLSQPTHRTDLSNQPTHMTDLSNQPTHRTDLSNQPTHRTDLSNQPTHRTDLSNQPTHRTDLSNQPLHRTDLSYTVLANQTSVWAVRLAPNSPARNVTLVTGTGNSSSNHQTCLVSNAVCYFNVSVCTSQEDDGTTWYVNVPFNTQNVQDMVLEFSIGCSVEAKQIPIWGIILAVILSILIGLTVLGFLLHRSGYLNCLQENISSSLVLFLSGQVIVSEEELSACLVPTSQLCSCEYTYRIVIADDCTHPSAEAEKYLTIFVHLVAALMNTSGGLIECRFQSDASDWERRFIDRAKVTLSQDLINSCVDRNYSERAMVTFQVKKYTNVVFCDHGLGDTSKETYQDKTNTAIQILRQIYEGSSKGGSDSVAKDNRIQFDIPALNKDINLFIAEHYQFITKIKEIAGTPAGRDIVIRIGSINSNTVDITFFFDELLVNTLGPNVDDGAEGVYFGYIKQIEVKSQIGLRKAGVIVRLHVNGTREDRLHKVPSVYGVKYNGQIHNLSIVDIWKKVIDFNQNGTDNADLWMDDMRRESSVLLPRRGDHSLHEPQHPVQHKPIEITENDVFISNEPMKRKLLSWTKHAHAWDRERPISTETVENPTTKTTIPMKLIPPANAVRCRRGTDDDDILQQCLSSIMQMDISGYALVVTEDMFTERHHIGDNSYVSVLLVSDPGQLLLLSFDTHTTGPLFSIGRQIKKKLLTTMEEFGRFVNTNKGISLAINTIVLDPTTCEQFREKIASGFSEDGVLPAFPDIKTNWIHEACYQIAAIIDPSISFRQGDDMLKEHTKSPIVRLQESNHQFNLIEGPPGAGKTFLGVELYKEIAKQNPNGVLFVTPNQSVMEFSSSEGLKNTMLVPVGTNFKDMSAKMKDNQHIIMDDVQSICPQSPSDWYRLFQAIHTHTNSKVYLLVDSSLQNYKGSNESQALKMSLKKFCDDHHISYKNHGMVEVVRNTRKIYSFMQANRRDSADFGTIVCNHKVQGDDILLCPVEDYRYDSKENGVLQLVRTILGYNVKGAAYEHGVSYTPIDIALLVDGNHAEEDVEFFCVLFQEHMPLTYPQRVRYPIKGMVIDELEKFAGLSSQVCIFVQGDSCDPNRNLANAEYKLHVVSRGISLVVFVVKMSTSMQDISEMGFDKLDSNINTTGDYVQNLLEVVKTCKKSTEVFVALEDITCQYGDVVVANECVQQGGIAISLTCFKSHRNFDIKGKTLILLTMVAIHPDIRVHLLCHDVLDVLWGILRQRWQVLQWEACYILAHLFSCGRCEWEALESVTNAFQTTESIIETAIEEWDINKKCDVANGDIDFQTYRDWLVSGQRVQTSLAAWSLCYLLTTDDDRYSAAIKRQIGLRAIHRTLDKQSLSENSRQHLSEAVSTLESYTTRRRTVQNVSSNSTDGARTFSYSSGSHDRTLSEKMISVHY